ncbi:MAG: histidine kinase [Rubrivivax sp.]|nr:histidine kinase [Rubrivivax sp.]
MKITPALLLRSMQSWYSFDLVPQGPAWMQWLWTGLFAAVIAFGFTILGFAFNAGGNLGRWLNGDNWLFWYQINFVIALTISVTIHVLFELIVPWIGVQRIRSFSHGQRSALFTAVPIAGVVMGWPLGVWLVDDDLGRWIRWGEPGTLVGSAILALGASGLIFLVFNAKARQLQAEKRATEAQLRLLQGQIEPHFLFNTLANVQTLIDHDPAQARQMLEAFTDYLRASLGTLRGDQGTLADELALVHAYLTLIQARMGERLRYRIEPAPGSADIRLPPLLLQPLVENAIHHGLEPKIDGGSLVVSATVDGDTLVLRVADDGLGRQAPPRLGARAGNGLALENLRQRLAAAYAGQASLVLDDGYPGTVATIRLPLERETT